MKKKITFFIYNAYTCGGAERVTFLIANALSKYYDVEIISMKKTADKVFFGINPGVKLIDLNAPDFEPLRYKFFLASRYLKKKLKDYKTDVFICVGMRYVPICIFMRRKAMFFSWEHYNSFENNKLTITHRGRVYSKRYADKVVVLTDMDRANNIKKYRINPNKIVRIYNPIEADIKKLLYNAQSKKIISCGSLRPVKGFERIPQVACKVFSKHPDWIWEIYGEGRGKGDYSTEN